MTDKEDKGFTVSDKRVRIGDTPTPAAEPPAEPAPLKSRPAAAPQPAPTAGPEAEADASEAPPLDFTSFVLSMASSVFIHLGEVPDPTTGERVPDLLAAQQTIDVLGILEEKTKGNLSPDEERLMKHILTELRLRFVATAQKGTP